MRRIWQSILAIGIVMLLWCYPAVALDVPPAPSLDRPIVDATETLSDSQIDELSTMIAAGRQEKDYQIGVYMLPSLRGQDIESYSLQVARAWGIGDRASNNGVLLIIAKNDRQLRIEVGPGLEGDLTDLEAGRIIANTIAPKFKDNAYYAGVRDGIESIQAEVEGHPDPHKNTAEFVVEGIVWVLVVGSMMLSWLASILGRSKSWWAGGVVGGGIGAAVAVMTGFVLWSIASIGVLAALGLLFDYYVSKEYRRSKRSGRSPSWWAGGGGWSGGSSGSSGGSFGGGGFSGGGASGSW